MSRCLRLRGYTTDPASLPVQYRAELVVQDASGLLGPDSLRLTLFGTRGETGVQRLDASRAAPGRTLACVFEGPNVGQMERLRIGLAPADDAPSGWGSLGPVGWVCGVLVSGPCCLVMWCCILLLTHTTPVRLHRPLPPPLQAARSSIAACCCRAPR